MYAHIPNSKFMVMAETSTFGIFRGRNVQAETSWAEMSVAEMSEHRFDLGCFVLLRSERPWKTDPRTQFSQTLSIDEMLHAIVSHLCLYTFYENVQRY